MRHRVKDKKLDRKREPRTLMLRNLASSIIIYEKVKTSTAKAKIVRSIVEKAITIAKKGDLDSRRRLIALLPQMMAVKKAIEVLSKRYADRPSGYTRIVKLGRRQGDGAEISQIELL